MAPIFWILIFLAVGGLCFFVNRSNRNHSEAQRSRELARQNANLRDVVAALSIERHFRR
jgi:hypothetical protein